MTYMKLAKGDTHYSVRADDLSITVSIDPDEDGTYVRLLGLGEGEGAVTIYPHQRLAIRALRRALQEIIDADTELRKEEQCT
jgi:hypothetical protein